MRSLIELLSDLYSPKRNPYLRLSEADRAKLAFRVLLFSAGVAALLAIWGFLNG